MNIPHRWPIDGGRTDIRVVHICDEPAQPRLSPNCPRHCAGCHVILTKYWQLVHRTCVPKAVFTRCNRVVQHGCTVVQHGCTTGSMVVQQGCTTSAIRQQFWVICDQFSTAHVGLHFVLLPVIILMWESDSVTPISYKSVKILAIRECYRPFFATFSVRMRHSAVILLPVWNTTEWHRFTIKVVKLFQYDINLGSFSANFELRMWDCAIFLLPLIILMSDFDSATPIS